jgi:hypothetical protein
MERSLSFFSAAFNASLNNEHAVAVGVKPVSFLDRLPIRFPNQFAAGKSRYEHQESGLGQMKVGQQLVDELKFIAGRDE